MLSFLKETSGSGLAIKLEAGVVEKVEVIAQRKLVALLVAIDKTDQQNTEMLKKTLEQLLPATQLQLSVILQPDKEYLMQQLLALQQNRCQ